MRRLEALLYTLVLALACLPAARCWADDVVAVNVRAPGEVSVPGSVAAAGGWVARWSRVADGYVLELRRGGGVQAVEGGLASSPAPLTAGRDARGDVVFLSTRCERFRTDARALGCSTVRLTPGVHPTLTRVKTPRDAPLVAQVGGDLVLVRTGSLRQDGSRCDRLELRRGDHLLRRLPRAGCGAITGLAVRAGLVATTSNLRPRRAIRPAVVVQRLSGDGRIAVANTPGRSEPLYSPVLTSGRVVAATSGASDLVDVHLRGRRAPRVERMPSGVLLAGQLAMDGDALLYGELQGRSSAERLVRSRELLTTRERTLPPEQSTNELSGTLVRALAPLTLQGQLARAVVQGVGSAATKGLRLVRTIPQAGVTVTLTAAPHLSTTTDSDGRWTLTVPPPLPAVADYTVSAATPGGPTFAAFGVTASVADMTLTATRQADGTIHFQGTVDPSLPGQPIAINGPRVVEDFVSTTVAADGRSFEATLPSGALGPFSAAASAPAQTASNATPPRCRAGTADAATRSPRPRPSKRASSPLSVGPRQSGPRPRPGLGRRGAAAVVCGLARPGVRDGALPLTGRGGIFKSMAAEEPVTVEAVLAGRASYDDLESAEDQAVVRAEWQLRIARGIAELDMTAELEARGTPYYSADAQGNVIEHMPGAGARPYVSPARDARSSGEQAP